MLIRVSRKQGPNSIHFLQQTVVSNDLPIAGNEGYYFLNKYLDPAHRTLIFQFSMGGQKIKIWK